MADLNIWILLDIWSDWELDLKSGSAGWPKETSLYKFLKGGVGDKKFGTKTPPFNEVADRMNYLIRHEMIYVSALIGNGEQWLQALEIGYLSPHRKLPEMCEEIGITKVCLRDRVKRAAKWLEARVKKDYILEELIG